MADDIAKKEKPVFIAIYGPDLETPTYAEMEAIRDACEKAGQPFILLPERADQILSAKDIASALDRDFGRGGKYEGREYTVSLEMHGGIGAGTHTHQINRFQLIESGLLLKSLLGPRDGKGRYLCTGIIDGSCHSVGSLVDLAALIEPASIRQDLHFLSNASFYEYSWQADGTRYLETLPRLAERNLPFTVERLKRVILQTAGNDGQEEHDPAVAEKIFTAGEPIDQKAIAYENLERKLGHVIKYLPAYQALYRDNPKVLEKLKALEAYGDVDEARKGLRDTHRPDATLSDYMYLADRLHDGVVDGVNRPLEMAAAFLPVQLRQLKIPKENDRISGELLYTYDLRESVMKAIGIDSHTDKGRSYVARLSDEDAPDAHLAFIKNVCKEHCGLALKNYQQLHNNVLMGCSESERREIRDVVLNEALVKSPATFFGESTQWKVTLSKEEVERFYVDAAKKLAQDDPLKLLKITHRYMSSDTSVNPVSATLPKAEYDALMEGMARKLAAQGPQENGARKALETYPTWRHCTGDGKAILKTAIGHLYDASDPERSAHIQRDLRNLLMDFRGEPGYYANPAEVSKAGQALQQTLGEILRELKIEGVDLGSNVPAAIEQPRPLVPPALVHAPVTLEDVLAASAPAFPRASSQHPGPRGQPR